MPARSNSLFTMLKRWIRRLTGWSLNLGMGWVVVMMVLTTVDVAGRYFFSKPVPGAIELSSFMLGIFGMLGMAYTHQKGANVRVTMVTRALPPVAANLLDILTAILTLQVVAMLAWYGVVMGVEEFHARTTTDTLAIPLYPLQFLMALGALLLGLEILVNLCESVNNVFKTQKNG